MLFKNYLFFFIVYLAALGSADSGDVLDLENSQSGACMEEGCC